MKKKLPVFIIFLIVIFTLYGCVSQQQNEANDSDTGMTVKPADISGESILEAPDENIYYYDLNLEKGMDITITKWIYKDDKWQVLGKMDADDNPERIWVSCDKYSMECGETSHNASRTESHDIPKGYFRGHEKEGTSCLATEWPITCGEEITLMSIRAGEEVEDGLSFKDGKCDVGIVFTLTVNDK